MGGKVGGFFKVCLRRYFAFFCENVQIGGFFDCFLRRLGFGQGAD